MKAFNWMQLSPLLLLVQGVLASSSPYGKYINTACTAASDCGLDTHLQCINNFCQCDSFTQIYDQSTQKCLLLLGQQCQIQQTTSQKHHHNYQHSPSIKCVPHANCTNGACRCKTGYKPSPDFLCKPDYGSPCHVHDDCDDGQGLICTSGFCQCFNSTWQFQGQFGCVDPRNPQYNEMLGLLNQTEYLLKENDLELSDMFNDLGLQNDGPDGPEFSITNILSARQFGDTYNTNDLQFAAQNTSPQMSGGRFNLQQLLTLFQTFRNLVPGRGGGGGGGGGGFLRNLFRGGGGGGGGGYPEASTTAKPEYGPPPEMEGYQESGKPEGSGMRMRMGPLNNFLRLFNQMIPIVRQLRMRFNPVKFFQNIVMRFRPSTTPAPAPAPAAIHNAPPTIISSNGNYQTNPIFESGQAQQASPGGGGGGGAGGFRFFMRTRNRFRNFLRRPAGGGGGGGGYAPANPPDKYGPPAMGYGPPPAADAPPPAEDAGADAPPPDAPPPDAPPPDAPPAADAPAGNAPQNYYTNNPRSAFQGQSSQRPQYSTVYPTSGGNQQQHNQIPQSAQQHTQQNTLQHTQQFTQHNQQGGQQGFQSNSGFSNQDSYSAGHLQANPPSFFQSQHNNNQHAAQNNHQQFNNHIQPQQHNSFNAQPTSHHQSTFVPHPQPSNNQPYIQQSNNVGPTHPPHHSHVFDSSLNSFVRSSSSTGVPSVTNAPAPPPIPQFKLQVPHHHHNHQQQKPESNHESLSQNFILSEADDPHPGFTPLSTPASPQPSAAEHHGLSFRTSARFERIGQEDHQPNTAAENWRETF